MGGKKPWTPDGTSLPGWGSTERGFLAIELAEPSGLQSLLDARMRFEDWESDMKSWRWSCWGLLSVCCAASSFAADGETPAELFDKLDANKDGQVTVDEVPDEHRPHLERLLRKGDKDANKSLSKEEWIAAHTPEAPPEAGPGPGGMGPGGRPNRPNPGQMFDRMDANKDGKLQKSEIPAGAPQPLRDMLSKVFEKAGKDELTRDELIAAAGPAMRAAGANGAGAGNGKLIERLKKLDKNGDGKVSADEMPAEGADRLKKLLERLGGGDSIDIKKAKEFAAKMGEKKPAVAEGAKPKPKKKAPSETDEPGEKDARPDDRRPEGDRRDSAGDERGPRDAGGRPPRPERAEEDRRNPEGRPDDERQRMRDGERGPDSRGPMDRGMLPGQGPMGNGPRGGLMGLLDENHDGRISRDEFSRAATYFGDLDQNHDGSLDPMELMSGGRGPTGGGGVMGPGGRGFGGMGGFRFREGGPDGGPRMEGGGSERGRGGPDMLLRQFDRDGDGTLSKEEIPERMRNRFDEMDADKNGKISPDELQSFLRPRFRNPPTGAGGPGRFGRPEGADSDAPRTSRPETEERNGEPNPPAEEKSSEPKTGDEKPAEAPKT